MKKITIGILSISLGLMVLNNSCKKDVFTETDAYAKQSRLELLKDSLTQRMVLLRDSLKRQGGVINYSVASVDASDASWPWSSGKGSEGMVQRLSGVVVTVAQYGKRIIDTTDASGIATFKDLRIGTVNVNIHKEGFTDVDFVALMPALIDTTAVKAYDVVRHVATMIPLFSTTTNLSTIKGIATVETDLTNNAPEVAANTKIIATIDVDNFNFQRYLYYPHNDVSYNAGGLAWTFDYYGVIKQIAFHSSIFTATTGTDGTFTLSVPSTPDGLPIRIFADDFVSNQSLLQSTVNSVPVWGVQSIRTVFGTDMSSSGYSTIPSLGLGAGNVQSAYVQFSAPTGSPAAQPTTQANATAVLTNSGIVSINITNPGEGYTQAPLVRIQPGTAFNSVQALATATISGGKLTGVTITNAGSGYKPSDNPTVTFTDGVTALASATPKIGYSISNISLLSGGSGYISAPTVIIASNSGTGATAVANMSGYVSELTMTNPGSGYTATPIVTISSGNGVNATAVANLTTSNQVYSVTVPVNLNYWTTKRVGTRITGAGSGALTDSTTLSSSGRISSISIGNAGAGYLTAPTVSITGGGGFGAVAHSTIAGGAVNTIIIDNRGQGYTSNPTISITPAPLGGTNATATATLEYQVTAVPLLASGNGYVSGTTNVQFETFAGSGVYIAAPGGVVAVLSMGVASLTITNPGTDYSSAPTVTIIPSNGVVTTPASATASILYSVKNLSVTAQGSGYEVNDAQVSFTPPPSGTTPVVSTITRNNGVLKRVILNNPGAGYTASPNVYMTVNALGVIPVRQALLAATVNGGQISNLTINDNGLGYDYNSDASGYYTITISTYNVGGAATAQANPLSGQISAIEISNPGAGYSVVPTVEIVNPSNVSNANGFGSGATATAVVTDGRISAINITNPGSGYYVAPTINITVASTLMKAVAKCVVSSDGRITGVDFTGGAPYTKGYGYTAIPVVTFLPSITGIGSGATGVAVLNNGQVDNVVITNQGSGYIGRNFPTTTKLVTPSLDLSILARAGQTFIKDISFGTGKRSSEQ